tara:strand:+ start:62 stop:271 length:210 start_codon:yes stop_codon:yes gene_type:complete
MAMGSRVKVAPYHGNNKPKKMRGGGMVKKMRGGGMVKKNMDDMAMGMMDGGMVKKPKKMRGGGMVKKPK